jgi:hypothetical protein
VPRSEFLLLGFDTEYQPLKATFNTEEIKAGEAKYEVLSYQFYAINSNRAEWSGIAIPDDGERLSFTDFIVHAISKGALLGQHVPKTIILVAHYNRADLPAFDDRKQFLWRLQNVRSSLVSSGFPSFDAAEILAMPGPEDIRLVETLTASCPFVSRARESSERWRE